MADIRTGISSTEAQWTGQRKVAYVNGAWYAIFQDAGSIYYRKSTDGGTNWGSDVQIDSGTDNVSPTLWVSSSLIYVCWSDTGGDAIYFRTIDTASADALGTLQTTGDLGALDTDNFNTICVTGNGNIYVGNTSDPDFLFSTDGGANWTPIATTGSVDDYVSVVPTGDMSDDVMFIGTSSATDSLTNVFACKFDGTSVGSEVQLSTSNDIHPSKGISVVTKSNGDLVVAYVDENGTNFDVKRKNYTQSTDTWADGTNFDTNLASVLGTSLTLNSNNNDIIENTLTGGSGAAHGFSSNFSSNAFSGVVYRINATSVFTFVLGQTFLTAEYHSSKGNITRTGLRFHYTSKASVTRSFRSFYSSKAHLFNIVRFFYSSKANISKLANRYFYSSRASIILVKTFFYTSKASLSATARFRYTSQGNVSKANNRSFYTSKAWITPKVKSYYTSQAQIKRLGLQSYYSTQGYINPPWVQTTYYSKANTSRLAEKYYYSSKGNILRLSRLVLKISKKGYDVKVAQDRNLVSHSNYFTLKQRKTSDFPTSVTIPASTNNATVTITHNLGYKPAYDIFVADTNGKMFQLPGISDDSFSTAGLVTSITETQLEVLIGFQTISPPSTETTLALQIKLYVEDNF